jgi:hypothetical protein
MPALWPQQPTVVAHAAQQLRWFLFLLVLPLLLLSSGWAVAGTVSVASAAALPPPQLDLPVDAARTILPTPHFSWQAICDPIAVHPDCGGYRIQIMQAGARGVVVDSTVASVLTRFVPVTPLGPGRYLWRVAALGADGTSPVHPTWSEQRTLFVVPPTHEIHIGGATTYTGMQEAFAEACASRVPTAVRFAPGIQRVMDPGFNGDIFASLANCSDLLLDFRGARLTFSKYVGFFALDGCKRVAIFNLTVDLAPLPYSALRIDSLAADFLSFQGTVIAGHPPPESLNITTRNKGEVMNPRTTRTKRGVIEVVDFVPDFSERAANGSYTVRLVPDAMTKRGLNPGLGVGDAFIVGERTGPPGFEVLGGSDVSFVGVNVHACANECFTSAYTSKLSILNTSIVLLPGRFKAANDGGHNHHSARIGAWIEGGQWHNTGDDICHVSALVMSATEQWTDRATGAPMLRLAHSAGDTYMRSHGGGRLTQIRVGDTLQFFNRSSGILLHERAVRSVSFDGGAPRGGVTVVALDASPGPLDLGIIREITDATNVFDLNATATQFVFRNNTVLNGRRFGVLAKGLRLVVEDNRFIGLGSGAVQFINAVTEGLCARSAVVRRNVVRDVMQLAVHGSPPRYDPNAAFWTSVLPHQQPDGDGGAGLGIPCHQDLLYSANTVSSGPHSVVQLYGTARVVVEASAVTRCGSGSGAQWGPWAFPGADSRVAVSSDNRVSNRTSASLCTKRASLVKAKASDSVYFVDFFYETGGGIAAASVLHPLGSCHQCGDAELCQRMGINVVDAQFISSRTVGSRFVCDMLPGPRVLRCPGYNRLLFEAQPGSTTVHTIDSCTACGGLICSEVIDAAPEYCATLSVSPQLFACEMASGAML